MDKKTTIDVTNMGEIKQQYLDKEGLAHFLEKLKIYIGDRIKSIYGTDISISEDNPNETIKDYIDNATQWDDKTSIKDTLGEIVGAYVKSIEGVSGDENVDKYFKVVVKEKTKEDNTPDTGKYEIYLEDSGFDDFVNQKVVSKLEVLNNPQITDESNNDYVNLSIDNDHGEITLTLDETKLIEKIEDINGYKVNGKQFTNESQAVDGEIVLDASDIKMGDIGESDTGINGEDNLQETIINLLEQLEDFHSEYINHTHSITLEMSNEEGGGIECDFNGAEGTTEMVSEFEGGENTENSIIEVSFIDSTDVVTKLPEFEAVELPNKDHTHFTTITPSGEIDSTFEGDSHTHKHEFEGDTSNTENSNLTINYDDSSCTLSILTSHNHLYTPIGNITDTTITPTGKVTSTFEGAEKTWESIATQSIGEFYNKTGNGATTTVVKTEIPGPGHTHKFTPNGNVDIVINYTEDTEVPSSQSTE